MRHITTLSIAKHTKVGMIWVAGRSPTLVSQNLKATTLTYLAIVLRKPTPQSFLSSTETTKIHGSFYFLEAAAGTVE